MTTRDPEAASLPDLAVLADANDQFHWGATIEAIKAALRNLSARNLNPTLAELLEAKIVRLETAGAQWPFHPLSVPSNAEPGPQPSFSAVS